MKKILGKLSKAFHKNGVPITDILPQLRNIFEELQAHPPKDAQKCLNMIINMITSETDFVQDVYNWALTNDLLTEQICTARVKCLAQNMDIDGALDLIAMMNKIKPHVRTFMALVETNAIFSVDQYTRITKLIRANNIIPSAALFSYLMIHVPTNDRLKELTDWAAQHYNFLQPIIAQRFQSISHRGICQNCQTQLKVLHLSNDQRNLMLNSIFEKETNPSIVRWVQTRDYDMVIDGANVAHYNNSPFDSRKVITMINKLNQGFPNRRILLVFSICRKKTTKSLLGKWKNVDIFYTRAGTNDDLSWLYAAIYFPHIWCITNDQMRDHVYYKFTQAVGRNVIDLWMERNIVTFQYIIIKRNKKKVDVQITLDLPLDYSVRPQWNDDHIHIPIVKNQWYCIPIKN